MNNNLKHYIIGFSIMYAIGNLTKFSTYTLESKIIGCTLASILIGVSAGFFIEWLQSNINQNFFDWTDVARTAIGTLLGGLTATLFPNHNIFMYVCLGISGILIIIELVFLYKIYKQRK